MFITSCAALNSNPNVGVRSVDLMVKSGNCSGALEILNAAAERGEPWAQLRLGYFSFSKQCSGISTKEGLNWLAKAACYVPKTNWEKGDELSVGPGGFFNTRDDSLNASDVLQQAAEANTPSVENMLMTKWYWTNLAANLYESNDPKHKSLNERVMNIEKNMSPETISKAKILNLCDSFRKVK